MDKVKKCHERDIFKAVLDKDVQELQPPVSMTVRERPTPPTLQSPD